MLALLPLSAALAATPEPLRDAMQGHFTAATDATWAVAAGDLPAAREAALKLDHASPAPLPKQVQPRFEVMRASARALAESETLEVAAARAADLGKRCAECHVAIGNGPELTDSDRKGLVTPGREASDRHMWGMYGLWTGLVAPDQPVFRGAADLLTPVPGEPAKHNDASRAASAAYVTAAKQAALATDDETRMAAYGGVLATCNTCHVAMGVSFD